MSSSPGDNTGGGGPGPGTQGGPGDMGGKQNPGGGGQDGGAGDGGQQNNPPPQNYVAGGISLMEIQIVVGGFGADIWSAKALLLPPPATLPTSQMVGGCKVTNESGAGAPGKSMDAGDLTIGGGPNGDLLLSYDPSLGIYTEDLAEPTSAGAGAGDNGPLASPSALFAANSHLVVEAGGGADLKMVNGMWNGVSSMSITSPQMLQALPTSGGLPVSWTADGAPGNQVEISLLSDMGIHVVCTSADNGSYTVAQGALATLPQGKVTLAVSRVFGGSAMTDKGPLHVESRSSYQIQTQQN